MEFVRHESHRLIDAVDCKKGKQHECDHNNCMGEGFTYRIEVIFYSKAVYFIQNLIKEILLSFFCLAVRYGYLISVHDGLPLCLDVSNIHDITCCAAVFVGLIEHRIEECHL